MTDDELKQLVANLAISQQKTDDELKQLVASMAVSQQKIEQTLADLAERQKQTDAQMAKTDAQMAKTDAQIARLEVQMAKTDLVVDRMAKKIDKLGLLVGNISNNQGDIAEEFFYRSLKKNPILNGIRFDWVERHLHNRVGEIEDEYDIVLLNGNSLAVVEVKAKAHEQDLEKLLNKKMANFPLLFSMYRDYQRYAGLATLVANDHLLAKAQELGLFLITQQGKHAEILTAGRALN